MKKPIEWFYVGLSQWIILTCAPIFIAGTTVFALRMYANHGWEEGVKSMIVPVIAALGSIFIILNITYERFRPSFNEWLRRQVYLRHRLNISDLVTELMIEHGKRGYPVLNLYQRQSLRLQKRIKEHCDELCHRSKGGDEKVLLNIGAGVYARTTKFSSEVQFAKRLLLVAVCVLLIGLLFFSGDIWSYLTYCWRCTG